MALKLKKEFVSMLSAMVMEVLSDDEEDDFLHFAAIHESLGQKSINDKKPQERTTPVYSSERRAHKEAIYLQKTRFEKYEDPVVDIVSSQNMCLKTFKQKKECFCSEHIDSSKIREVSVIVVPKGGGPGLSDMDFKSFWRMSRSTVEIVYSLINPTGTEAAVSPVELLAVLWHIVTNEPIDQLESRFSTPKAKLLQLETTVFERLCCLRPSLEKWPAGDAVSVVVDGFKSLDGLGTLGAVGSVHFLCEKAPFNPKNFVNNMGHSSAIFHLVTDHRGAFSRNSYFFWPGKSNPLPDGTTLKDLPVPDDTFLVGNFEYSKSKQIIVPYWGGKLSQQQCEFNRKHRNCIQVLEGAVLLLISRFKALTSLRMTHSDYVRQLVTSCVLLHNLCIDLSDDMEVDTSLDVETYLPPVLPPKKEIDPLLSKRRDEFCAELAVTEEAFPGGKRNLKKRKCDPESNKFSRDIPATGNKEI